MNDNRTKWIVTVDARGGRLVRCRPVPPGRWHADEIDRVANAWERFHEHHRPDAISLKGGDQVAGYAFGSDGHADEEMLRRFAKDATVWLERIVDEHAIQSLDLFAPPRTLGALRAAISKPLAARLSQHEGNLNNIPIGDLPDHAAVSSLIGAER
ncbi:MAG: host attachment protein [Phycisphaerales bacterium]|nr:host attachment protein [Phycisphaerales bacterium]